MKLLSAWHSVGLQCTAPDSGAGLWETLGREAWGGGSATYSLVCDFSMLNSSRHLSFWTSGSEVSEG